MKKLFTLFLIICFSYSVQAQNSGDQVFDNSVLHEVRFTFEQADYWQQMVNNFEFNMDDVPYILGAVTIDGVDVDSVGVRFKGFTSYTYESDKKPIKIDFNEFVPGKRLDGLRKLNLNNATGDPSMQRDVICYDLMRKIGVKAPRTAYTRVYFNDQYWGLYQLIEQIDKEFLQNNFTNDDGNLIKNKGWSHFEWFGPDDSAYHPPFEMKTNKDQPDWEGFVNMLDILNNGTDQEIENAFADVFNVDLFLKVLAIDVATNNWDAYIEHGRNWYIYEDVVTDKFHWIPWDYNFSLSSSAFQINDDFCEVFSDFTALQEGTTTITFLENAYSNKTISYAWDFGDGNISDKENPVHTYLQAGTYTVCLEVKHDEDCLDQICKPITTSRDLNDCSVQINGTCPYPVDEVFALTLSFSPSCCGVWSQECEDIHNWLSGGNGGFGATDFTIDQRDNDGVLINRLLGNPNFNERYYTVFCDLLNNVMVEDSIFALIDHNRVLIDSSVQEDPNFLFDYDTFLDEITSLEEGGIKAIITDRIVTLRAELDSIYTCPEENNIIAAGDLVINEFMASNDMDSGISDTDGEYDDWIELYNNSDERLNLSGVYLSDDLTNPTKWSLPYGTLLGPDRYLIIWADNDSIQFGLHTNFKLSKDAGQIVLSNADGSIIDDISYTAQTTNIASARVPNGTGPFTTQPPTHGFNNDDTSGAKNLSTLTAKVFPNPTSSFLNIELSEITAAAQIKLIASDGKLMYQQQISHYQTVLDTSPFPGGIYNLHIVDQNGGKFNKRIVIAK